MPIMLSYISADDASYTKPQNVATPFNIKIISPGVPQSLPQMTAPPQLRQLLCLVLC